jgi:multimeric flavodoxin WrbA
MKVLMLNGSPRAEGNTKLALMEMASVFSKEGIEYEIIDVGGDIIRGCLACGYCAENSKCVIDDAVNEIARKLDSSDGLVIGSPVYYAGANGTLVSLLDRLFYSSKSDKRMKVGACVVAARRGGLSATYDQLNKYFAIVGMPIATSQYWNSIHGAKPLEAKGDAEGLQTMRTLAENMVFLMRSISLGKEKYGLPEKPLKVRTNFIR